MVKNSEKALIASSEIQAKMFASWLTREKLGKKQWRKALYYSWVFKSSLSVLDNNPLSLANIFLSLWLVFSLSWPFQHKQNKTWIWQWRPWWKDRVVLINEPYSSLRGTLEICGSIFGVTMSLARSEWCLGMLDVLQSITEYCPMKNGPSFQTVFKRPARCWNSW